MLYVNRKILRMVSVYRDTRQNNQKVGKKEEHQKCNRKQAKVKQVKSKLEASNMENQGS